MNVLDGDDVRLSYQGRYAQRDIVQVSFTLHFPLYLLHDLCVFSLFICQCTKINPFRLFSVLGDLQFPHDSF